MKKVLMGFVSFAAVLTIGSFAESYTSQADHGRPPAPQRPDLAHGDHGGAPAYDHGRPPAPAYEYKYVDVYMDHGEHI
ncbi:hypothetical protein P4120_00395 [Bacillus thuringiensis]|nr:hypothetical protein [Bacillus thuringiensis]